MDVCANLTACSGRMHLCPSTATAASDASAEIAHEDNCRSPMEKRVNLQIYKSETLMSLL